MVKLVAEIVELRRGFKVKTDKDTRDTQDDESSDDSDPYGDDGDDPWDEDEVKIAYYF
jgi:hypothetical protein